MLFSFDWLRQYVDPGAEPAVVGERLTAAGLAVEGIERRGDDTLLDVDVTTNRPDCMCHLGLAREIAVLFDRPLRPPVGGPPEVERSVETAAAVEVEDPADCPRYVARVVEGVRVGPSPGWLAARLEAIGQRPINNVVDITNFVLWELGQPIHAFDLDTLTGARVVVRRARAGEQLETLDGQRRTLDPEVLVIADGERAVALAGIMGGLHTEVTAATTDVLIESAHFEPRSVRRGSRRLDLHTDASHRFERGADPEAALAAADRVAGLVAEIAGGRVLAGAVDRRPGGDLRPLAGRIDAARLDRLAGAAIPAARVERWLAGLGFELERRGEEGWRVRAPSWRFYDLRPDPARGLGEEQGEIWEADLFEEVLRIHGYEAIPSALPPAAGPDAGSSAGHRRREIIRHHLAACGLVEAINFAFHDATVGARFPVLAARGEPLRLANPISELYAEMRRSLLPGLHAAAGFNLRRGAGAVELFEIGHVFPGGDAPELEALALIAGGTRGRPWSRRVEIDLLDLKGTVESLAARFGLEVGARPAELPGFVRGTATELVSGGPEGRVIGCLGQLEDPDAPFPLFAAELEAGILGAEAEGRVRLPSRFPGIEADLTLTHPLTTPWAEIRREIEAAGVEDLVDFGLRGRYRGEGVAAGRVNTTIFFHYNAAERSLTQEEVNQRHEALRRRLEDRFSGPEAST